MVNLFHFVYACASIFSYKYFSAQDEYTSRLSMIFRVNVVINRTVVDSD